MEDKLKDLMNKVDYQKVKSLPIIYLQKEIKQEAIEKKMIDDMLFIGEVKILIRNAYNKGKEAGRREVLEIVEDHIQQFGVLTNLAYKNILKDLTSNPQTPQKTSRDTPTQQLGRSTNGEEGKVSNQNEKSYEESSSEGCGEFISQDVTFDGEYYGDHFCGYYKTLKGEKIKSEYRCHKCKQKQEKKDE